MLRKKILTIAGSDTTSGAGIQADIATFRANGAFGFSVISAITSQNSKGVHHIHPVEIQTIKNQLETLLEDIEMDAVKIGMLYSSTAIEVVFDILQKYNVGKIILDPMISSSSGALLLQESSLKFLLDKANFCSVITPNTIEINLIAKSLGISKSKNIELANQVAKKLNTNIIVTGGHIEDLQKSKNILIDANGNNIKEVEFTKINTQHTHGSGCVFSSALAFFYAETENLEEALARATLFTTKAVEQGKNNVFSNDKKSYCSVQPVCSKCNSW